MMIIASKVLSKFGLIQSVGAVGKLKVFSWEGKDTFVLLEVNKAKTND